MTTDTSEYDLKQLLDELKAHEGRGTELISLYVPPDTNLQTVHQQIVTEHSQAENIKSDRTQKHVQAALQKVKTVLERYQHTPETGLAVFAGHVDGDMVEYVFDDLPSAVPERNYICSDTFETGPLEHVLTPNTVYGLVVLDRNEATIGRLIGDRIDVRRDLESGVMGKSKAGGQSAQRFARERERQKHEFFKQVAETAKEEFIDPDGTTSIDGLLLGGTTITVDDFTSNDYLDHRLADALLGTYGTSYGNKRGLDELVRKAQDVLAADKDSDAKETMETFFTALADDDGDTHATYGPENVETALQYGAVDTLLLSDTLPRETVDPLVEAASNTGADVTFVPESFERGSQLADAFGGIAALLRYDANLQ